MTNSMKAVAEARSNIALVKYWGKCDLMFNLPAVPSLSFTLDCFSTRTEVRFDPSLREDCFFLNGNLIQGPKLWKVSRHLDRITQRNPNELRAEVHSQNNFPTAAGLASSASGFAALTLAGYQAFSLWKEHLSPANLSLKSSVSSLRFGTPSRSNRLPSGSGEFFPAPDVSPALRELSILARQGSGSAARSIHGGLVLLGAGIKGQVDSSFATQICDATAWPDLQLVVGISGSTEKEISSTEAMNRTKETSPYYDAFQKIAPLEIEAALSAIREKDIQTLGTVTERSALRMHAAAMAADPGIVYLRGVTLEGLHAVRTLRTDGIPAWFTCDAGPHPKALTLRSYANAVKEAFESLGGIKQVVVSSLGEGAQLVTNP